MFPKGNSKLSVTITILVFRGTLHDMIRHQLLHRFLHASATIASSNFLLYGKLPKLIQIFCVLSRQCSFVKCYKQFICSVKFYFIDDQKKSVTVLGKHNLDNTLKNSE